MYQSFSKAFNEILKIIKDNKTAESLRVFFSTLNEYKRPLNSIANEYELKVLLAIAMEFKKDMIDPLDKPPSL